MKHSFTLSVSCLFAAVVLFSCGKKEDKGGQPYAAVVSDIEEVADTLSADTVANLPFAAQKFKKEKGENKLEIEYPTEGNAILLDSIRTWINDELGGTYRGDLADGNKLFRHYASQLGEDPDIAEYGGFTMDEFDVEYKNGIIVTYHHTSYIYEGGAHGVGGDYGTTFLQETGRQFNRRCITSYKSIHGLIVDGLKKYFKVKTDAELMECLLGPKSVADIPAPAVNPWIEEDGVAFSYTPYEIAPYSAGCPKFVVPFDKIMPYLTPEGQRFVEK